MQTLKLDPASPPFIYRALKKVKEQGGDIAGHIDGVLVSAGLSRGSSSQCGGGEDGLGQPDEEGQQEHADVHQQQVAQEHKVRHHARPVVTWREQGQGQQQAMHIH